MIHKRPLIIAHRGASGYAPEHTMQAYKLAMEDYAADYLELDLQITKDGFLICMHDAKLDRTTNGTGLVIEHSISELKKLDAGKWFGNEFKNAKIPTLEEVFQTFGHRVNYYIEVKNTSDSRIVPLLLEMIEKYGLLSRNTLLKEPLIIQSFSSDILKEIHNKYQGIALMQLTKKGYLTTVTDEELYSIKTYAHIVGPHIQDITNVSVIEKLHSIGLEVHVYTVNKVEDKQKLQNYGIDGYFTDYL